MAWMNLQAATWMRGVLAAAVHHGGSDTTHSAARAGKPSIVMRFAGDQPFWADRLCRLGIAPPTLSTARPGADRLAADVTCSSGTRPV